MTSSHAALCSRSIADWASNGSASMPRQAKSASNSLSGRLAELQNRLATSPGVATRTRKFTQWGLLECAESHMQSTTAPELAAASARFS